MSDRFGVAALRLCAIATQLLGWRPDTFWHATPSDLANALAPLSPTARPIGRDELSRLMERDNDR